MKAGIHTLLFVLLTISNLYAYVDRSGPVSEGNMKYQGEYLMTALGTTTLDPNKVTHLVVVGTAMKEDSDQFFQTGLVHGYKYRELYPSHQVVVISAPEVVNADNEEVFKRFNLPIIKQVDAKLNVHNLIKEMKFFKKIASFDFYGHSSPWAVKLGKKDSTLEPTTHAESLKVMRPHFTNLAYATLNGCNGGFILAPYLSKVWGIPVSGSLTSTSFERLQADGWYKKYDRTATRSLSVNTLSFKDAIDCKKGVCWRLKTSRKSYSSYWGKFKDGGLSFPKFFCKYDSQNGDCLKSMALMLISFPSVKAIDLNSTKEDYKTVVYDYLCSTAKDPLYFDKCVKGIENAIMTGNDVFQMHPGNALECNFKGCNATIKCKKRIFGRGPRPGSCKVKTTPNEKPTTLVREFKALMKGWDLLH